MKNKLVTVIVPIYNVENYLIKCIESIINQTYKNLEIILIDDGSDDNCPQICDEYAKKDKRIKVIHQKNSGISTTRNIGLNTSTGEYIVFVDSDDYIESTMIEKLYMNLKKENADISCCNYYNVYDNSKEVGLRNGRNKIFTHENKYQLLVNNYKIIIISPWGKMYSKNIFKNIRYPDKMIMEDSYILTDILKVVNKITYINEPLYYYVQRKDSIMNSFNLKRLDGIKAQEKRLQFCLDNHLTDLIDLVKLNYIYSLITRIIPGLLSIQNKKITKEMIDKTKKLSKEIRKSEYLTTKEKVKTYILSYFPLEYIYIRKIIRGVEK